MSIRDIINNLIDTQLASMVYYDHGDVPYYHNRFPTEHQLPDYDGSNELYSNYEPCIEIAGSGDYTGSTIDIANRRYIEENYDELFESEGIIYSTSDYGYEALVVFFLRPSVIRSGLMDDLESLPDYYLLDDELESQVTEELLEEAWELWGRNDFENEIENRTELEFEETEWQESLFWEILRYGNGCEYFSEGTSVYIDMNEVFKDSESIIELIKENCAELESGEYEITGEYQTVGKSFHLSYSYVYQEGITREKRELMLGFFKDIDHEGQTISQEKLNYWGVKQVDKHELFWNIEPINKVLKEALKSGINHILPMRYDRNSNCDNCHRNPVMVVNYGKVQKAIFVCPDCYNKLMDYWPKCDHCKVKNVNASLQLSLLPDLVEDSNLTCQDCKNYFASL